MNKISSIIIVGGGTAGWMTASYLNKVLLPKTSEISIKLIESPDIETIGVGEATVPTIRDFFSLLGISEKDLLVATNATIKSAIKFVDWYQQNDNGYYHPFEAPLYSDGVEISEHWAAEKLKGHTVEDFAHATGVLAGLCDVQKTPKVGNGKDYHANTLYAYHLDAVMMAAYLRKISIERGVVRIEDTVKEIKQKNNGEISSLITERNGEISADFYIDCTGFSSLLIEKTLKEKFVSYEDELLCNSAIAVQTPYPKDSPFADPYTTATAKSSGWIWEIGLAKRKGNGYVFSDKFQSFEDAETEFRDHLECAADGLMVRKLNMRIGRRDKFWSKNCIAIGLSGGFVEPLESTGLQFIQVALELFLDYFPPKEGYELLQRRYNEVLRAKFDDVKDFIVMHYCLSEREDSEFWKYVKYDLKISDSLNEQLERWKYKLPSHSDLKEIGMFGAPNYMYILAGMNKLIYPTLGKASHIPTERSIKMLEQMKQFRKGAIEVSLSHEKYIGSLHEAVKPSV